MIGTVLPLLSAMRFSLKFAQLSDIKNACVKFPNHSLILYPNRWNVKALTLLFKLRDISKRDLLVDSISAVFSPFRSAFTNTEVSWRTHKENLFVFVNSHANFIGLCLKLNKKSINFCEKCGEIWYATMYKEGLKISLRGKLSTKNN